MTAAISDPIAVVVIVALLLLAFVALLASIRHPFRRLRVGFFLERNGDDDHPQDHP